MSILITGGTGNLGKSLARKLLERGYNDLVLLDYMIDNEGVLKIIKDFDDKAITVEEGDIRQVSKLIEIMLNNKVSDVFHLAAVLSSEGEEDPIFAYQINVVGTLNILEASRICKIKRIVFPSTISTFGPDVQEPVSENAPQHPTSFYGITKVISEHLGLYYARRFGLDFRSLRFPRIVNHGRKSTGSAGYPSTMIENAAKNIPYEENVNEDYVMPLIYIKEAVNILINCYEAENISERIYNLAGITVSAKEIATIIKKIIPSANISFKSKESVSHLAIPLHYDDSRLHKELGKFKKYPLEELINDFIEEVRRKI